MEYRDDGFVYDNKGKRIGDHDISKTGNPRQGGMSFILVLGIGIALFENGTKWMEAAKNYFSNLLYHPAQLFHLDTIIFLFFMSFFGYQVAKRVF